jgi:hypothetical protein
MGLLVFAQSWQSVGGGTDFPVHALLSWGGHLYVGGRFTTVGGTALQAQGIARWTANGWRSIATPGAGGAGKIHVMTVYRGKIIVGGEFTGIGGTNANNIAAYDPVTHTWSPVGGGVNGEVLSLYVYDGELLVGGNFTRVGSPPQDQPIAAFARWDGATWKAPDPLNPSYALMGAPLAFAEYNGKLYLGGSSRPLITTRRTRPTSPSGIRRLSGFSLRILWVKGQTTPCMPWPCGIISFISGASFRQ